jgi:flagellar M-ring protein FliF
LVDGTYTPAEDGSEPAFAPRNEAELSEMQTVVENAMGFNSARGDRVKIASVQFRDRQRDDDAAPVEAGMTPTMMGGAGAGALLLLVVLWMALRKKKTRVNAEVLQLPAKVGDAQVALARAEAGLGGGALPPGAEGGMAGALPEAKDAARERVLELAAADPERTADIIRGWLRADQPA